MWKEGEIAGYAIFNTLLQSFAARLRGIENCSDADEFARGFLYALEDKMAELELTTRGDD